ncbi:tyrosine-type recombinase/integrase [Azorhizobium doebereinerae]|uniref:tyrosine-type recombinase/integrase n=1 Tax=Azorhizobium doebereinerae TaxID=281091 RepID=UPI001FD9D0A8|nr:site-specific integrase [Azorhizobium doebereinerae]
MDAKFRYTCRERDRHGKERIYFRRRPGEKRIELPFYPRGETPPEGFTRAYHGAMKATVGDRPADTPAVKVRATSQPTVGTFRWLCAQYFASGEFRQLGPSTRTVRRGILEHCLLEPTAPGSVTVFADLRIEQISAKGVRVLRDRKAGLPEAANGRVKAIRQVFAWAIKAEPDMVSLNPARDVPYLKGRADGFHTWTIEEVQAFAVRHPLGSKAHLALALLLFSGVRRSDVVKLGPQMIRNGWLRFAETKGATQIRKDREIPVLPILASVIEASDLGHLAFLVTAFGRPFTANGFGNWFRKRCDEAGLPHCSAHGLRKAGATIAAENGATEHQLMAMYGWESPKQAAIYTRRANRRKLAGAGMPFIDLGNLDGIEDIAEAPPEGEREDEAGTDYPNLLRGSDNSGSK